MISPEHLRESWDLLQTLEPSENGLRVREVENVDNAAGHILLGLDNLMHRHLLIPVATGIRIVEDRRSSGVQITAHPLLDGTRLRPFVDLVCMKPHLQELFSIVVSEALEQLTAGASRPDRTCRMVLDRWRELLEREPSGQVGMEKLVGLFGELWYLREIVRHEPDALQYWTGPIGARHDLSNGKIAIEVKSTLSRQGRFFEIHGHQQLEPPEAGQLYLATLKLEQVPASGESLPELVTSIMSLGGDRHTLLTLLLQTSVGPAELDNCKDIHFRVIESRIYEVKEGFPRITSRSFTGGTLPAGVIKLTYQIDLSTEPPYALDERAISNLFTALASGVNVP